MLGIQINLGEDPIQILYFNKDHLRMRIKKFKLLFKTENLIQGDEVQEYDELDEEINLLSDDDSEPHPTQQDYEQYLGSGQLCDEENINNFDEPSLQYKVLIDSILAELHNKYDLRLIDKIVVVDQLKKVLL
jgi:hypothetical protein